MTWSLDTIENHIDTTNILNIFNTLGMKNNANMAFTSSTAVEVANEHIDDELNKGLFKDVNKLVKSMNKELESLSRETTEAANEISKVVSEITSDQSFKSNVTSSYPEPKFGGQSLKALIYMSRQR